VAVVSIELQNLGEHSEMSHYMARKHQQISRQRASIDRVDQDKPKMVLLTAAERAKAFRDRRRAEYKQCRYSRQSLMELHVEMRSADTDKNVDESTDPEEVQLRAPKVRPPTRELWHKMDR
jgi:hypothetical protein